MFFNFGILDIVDICCVALVLFYIYRLMKYSRSLNIFVGIIFFAIVWLLVSHVLQMKLLGTILDKLVSVGMIALIVIFQDEIRSFFYRIGSSQRLNWLKFFSHGHRNMHRKEEVMPLVMACMNMSKKKTGALIIIERNFHLDDIIASGEIINSDINQLLIENIFFKNSPLHDGAMIISNNKIKATGCILPVSHAQDIPKSYGLRHRAALGISENSDAIAIVVSEESGKISTIINGNINMQLTAEELESILSKEWSS